MLQYSVNKCVFSRRLKLSLPINQSIKTHFYSAICRERIRGQDPDLSSCVIKSSKAMGRPERRPVDRVCWAAPALVA